MTVVCAWLKVGLPLPFPGGSGTASFLLLVFQHHVAAAIQKKTKHGIKLSSHLALNFLYSCQGNAKWQAEGSDNLFTTMM